jgi:nucleotide-binding universal stress UspA family protein
MFGASWDEVGVMFSLSAAQTAATLAATFVGLDIGLFDTSLVNAVMILILVSLIVSSLTATRFGRRIPRPPIDVGRLGRSVLVPIEADEPVSATVQLAARLARVDGGVVRPLVVVTAARPNPSEDEVEHAEQAIGALGLEVDLEVRHDDNDSDGITHAARSLDSSLVLVTASGRSWLPPASTAASELVRQCGTPVAFVRPGAVDADRVVLVLSPEQAANPGPAAQLATAMVSRLRTSGLGALVVAGADVAEGLLAGGHGVPVERADVRTWPRDGARPEDLVVVPGGRNGAAIVASAVAEAERAGSTVIAIADADALSVASTAADALGIVTG